MDIEKDIERVTKIVEQPITLVFHNDADGLCSGAIAKRALEKIGIKPKMFCIEKMYPEVIERIHEEDRLIVYLDIGAGQIGLIEKFAKGNVIILDHHKTRKPTKPNIYNLDPELYGYSGDSDVCGSCISYMFFSKIADIKEMRDAVVVGAMEIPGNIRGLNRKFVDKSNIIKRGERESYKTRYGKRARSVSKDLTILGAVGYYQKGPILGLRLLFNGYDDEIKQKIKLLEERRKEINRRLLTRIKINESKHFQWFFAGDAYKGMGVKVIGTFCSYLTHRNIAPDKVLLGFMNVEPIIPMFEGMPWHMKGSYVKVSARAPYAVEESIKTGEFPSLGLLMHNACESIGGFGDGHDVAASGVIPRGRESELIEEMESIVEKGHGKTLVSYI
ncbi:MAG: DHH family phosphoesterase [Candidatus Diapherotrites archaeon]|nr:DHH family phosphoesterase [Candidatus Diapherotrites archaeon]